MRMYFSIPIVDSRGSWGKWNYTLSCPKGEGGVETEQNGVLKRRAPVCYVFFLQSIWIFFFNPSISLNSAPKDAIWHWRVNHNLKCFASTFLFYFLLPFFESALLVGKILLYRIYSKSYLTIVEMFPRFPRGWRQEVVSKIL